MGVIQRVTKPTTRKGKKVIQSREPKPIEGPKQCIFMQGRKTSEKARALLKDLYDFKKPDAVFLKRKNDIIPFEDASLIEKHQNGCNSFTKCWLEVKDAPNMVDYEIFLNTKIKEGVFVYVKTTLMSQKKDAALFSVATHSKKRPHNIVFGRTFDFGILDMIELGVENFKPLHEFANNKICTGIKPCLIFNGPAWDQSNDLKRLKSLFIDFFQRDKVESIRLQGLEHVLSFTATENNAVYLRSYRLLLKKSGQRTPRIELEEIGPSIDFSLRRTKLGSDDLYKEACRKPRELRTITKKNISRDAFGTKHGRVHMGKQGLDRIQTRKMKGLKKTSEEKKQHRQNKKAAVKLQSAQPQP